ncbi:MULTISPECIES: ABC transporter ATP-binding protein [Streptococcus]|mgnify:FL=1|jgi:ABC transporter, ATP-binding protein|uniref:ABC transporter ATP-binding protein n=1 Tax=Streptococcus TaxID=1301 RepID=UPI00073BF416|nr:MULTISPECIES: ABC transporter ATP-binding protein [Streptococcus]KTF20999.1 ABC transporter [Streptococcus gordonii]KXC02822.1 ABC transporter [Streptococcus gordonii]MBN2960723.1 ABC transporter ATP-binding protein [Streptococcus gordonii]MBW7662920.1 ABC transporter ATP-binding protein [Streptococcus gordonii]MBZ2122929.1 ABC transporter ATP-binding protein [Streptococcus gordonii]
MSTSSLLRLEHVQKNYGKTEALSGVNLDIQPGRIVGLLGPNGSGKTTIIKLINGLLQPTSGQVLINGEKPSPKTKKVVSYLPDTTYLGDNMKIKEVFAMFKDFYSDFDEEKANHLLEDLNLDEKSRLKNLSKGNKEKVQLILVMSRKADLYVLDEPIGGVDPAARDYILKTIIQNRSENSSVLISTHLISDIEDILDDVIFIKDGEILLQEDANELRRKHDNTIDHIFRDQFRI